MKQCCTCKETKDFTEFHQNKNSKDGFVKRCKACQKKASAEHYANNKEKYAALQIERRKANPELTKERRRLSYERNKANELAKCKEWRNANRGLRRAYKEARLEAETQRTPQWADMERINSRYALAKYLEQLDGRKRHVDHVIPLRGQLVSGLHVHDNLQILLAKDNLSKSNSYEVK